MADQVHITKCCSLIPLDTQNCVVRCASQKPHNYRNKMTSHNATAKFLVVNFNLYVCIREVPSMKIPTSPKKIKITTHQLPTTKFSVENCMSCVYILYHPQRRFIHLPRNLKLQHTNYQLRSSVFRTSCPVFTSQITLKEDSNIFQEN